MPNSVELVTVWRGFDSLRGFGGQGSAIDDGNTYFSIFLFSPKQKGQGVATAQQKALHLFSSVWGEGKGH